MFRAKRHLLQLGGVIAILLLAGLASAADYRAVDPLLENQEPVHVTIHGSPVDFDVPPVIVNGRTFVEVNGLFERLNIDLSWDPGPRRVTGQSNVNGQTIQLDIGSQWAYVNGNAVWLDAAPFIASEYGRTMVPLAFVAEHAANEVTWVNETRTAIVRKAGLSGETTHIHSAWQMAHHSYRGYHRYGEVGPISITPGWLTTDAGDRHVYLVALSGTDMKRADEHATGWWTNVVAGLFDAETDYQIGVRNAIHQNVPQGSNLVLTGHSQGGMIAQHIAADPWIQSNYTVKNTVTFGSPKTGSNREGQVRRLADWIDPVAYASLHGNEFGQNFFGPAREWSGIGNPINAHNQSYLREDVWGAYDAVGTKNGDQVLVIDSDNTTFYPAPDL